MAAPGYYQFATAITSLFMLGLASTTTLGLYICTAAQTAPTAMVQADLNNTSETYFAGVYRATA